VVKGVNPLSIAMADDAARVGNGSKLTTEDRQLIHEICEERMMKGEL
jgi:hypothetical protein